MWCDSVSSTIRVFPGDTACTSVWFPLPPLQRALFPFSSTKCQPCSPSPSSIIARKDSDPSAASAKAKQQIPIFLSVSRRRCSTPCVSRIRKAMGPEWCTSCSCPGAGSIRVHMREKAGMHRQPDRFGRASLSRLKMVYRGISGKRRRMESSLRVREPLRLSSKFNRIVVNLTFRPKSRIGERVPVQLAESLSLQTLEHLSKIKLEFDVRASLSSFARTPLTRKRLNWLHVHPPCGRTKRQVGMY